MRQSIQKSIIIFALTLISITILAQDSINYKQIHFLKIIQSNDLYTYWFQSDKYFTDGVDIEIAHSIFNNKISDAVLFGFKNTPYKDFSINITQDMYTPENTQSIAVDSNDRPYAGQLYFTFTKYTNRFFKGQKLTSQFFIGIQGPAAFGGKAQNFVHRAIKNKTSKGWDNQISNGIILDYEVQYMAIIPISSPITELHYFANTHIGTLNNSIDLGLRFKLGRYTDSYMNFYGIANPRNKYSFNAKDISKMSKNRRKIIPRHIRNQSLDIQAKYLTNRMNRKFQFYFFAESIVNYVIRDGSVQGSLVQFSDNIYEYNYSDYNHLKLLGRYGFVLQYSHLYLEYARYLQNDTFKNHGVFGYGRLIISFVF